MNQATMDLGLAGASFSRCRTYRYTLTRTWDNRARRMVVIGLNPSTADEVEDDPTIRRRREQGDGRLLRGPREVPRPSGSCLDNPKTMATSQRERLLGLAAAR